MMRTQTKGAARLHGLFGSVLILSATMFALSGCGSGSTPTPTPSPSPTASSGTQNAPRSLFGQWYLVSASGGITGSGYPFAPGTEAVTFNENGTFTRVSNGQTSQGTYQVSVATSTAGESNTDTPQIISYSTTTLTEAMTVVSDTRLVLSERAADGYVREYERTIIVPY